MAARTAAGETRWERAVAEARRLMASASGSELALATTADGLVEGPTTDGALVESALDRLSPGGGDGPWPSLAEAGAVHFITDGALPRRLPDGVVVHSVHEPAPNVAITSFTARPSFDPAQAADLYLEIANFAPRRQPLRLTLTRGAAEVFARDLDAGAGESLRQVVPIPRGGHPELRARVSARENALGVDDEAVAWIARARPVRIAVVGDDTRWLRAAFDGNPDVRATFSTPGEYRPGDEDAAVFTGWAPEAPPARPALLFAPPPSTAWLGGSAAGTVENGPRWDVPGTHPVVLGVDPFTLWIGRARAFASDTLVPVAHSARRTPLVYVSEAPDRRLVVVTFGAAESNLAGAPGFPVLLGNALDWLTNPVMAAADAAPAEGGRYHLPPGVARVTGPGGGRVALTRVGTGAIASLREPGLYAVEGGGATSHLAVNVGNPHLSDLMRASAFAGAGTRAVQPGASGRPLWIYFVLFAFLLAAAEWWTWQRRITV
jgi:hypothetical protein